MTGGPLYFMDETNAPTRAASEPEPTTDLSVQAARKKKKDKVRSAWISFIGRIVAQIVGAVASIALAVTFLQRKRSDEAPPSPGVTAPSVAAPRVNKRDDPRLTLAVLPLSNFSSDPQQDYFADGMTEALIADLAQLDGLRVISRTSVMQYRTQQKQIRQIADELGADMIVEGSVVRSGDRVRVTAQLIDAERDVHVWARSYERTLRDVLSLQGQLAGEIAKEVRVALTPLQQGRFAARAAVDPNVYDLYLRGRHAWNLRTEAGFNAAAKYFQEAIRRDPNFALAHAGLADVYALPGAPRGPGESSESRAKAIAAVTKALELDDSLAEAHTSRAAIYLFRDRDRPAAEREFQRAIELNPGYPTARQWYAVLLSETGRDAEALKQAGEAVAIDPLSGTMRQTLGLVHYNGRRYKESVETLHRALELNPQLELARTTLAKALYQQGAFAEVVKIGDSGPQPANPDLMAVVGLAHLRSGATAQADAILKTLRSRTPLPVMALSIWYCAIGDRDQAMAMLTRGTTPGAFPPSVAVDPLFDPLRTNARFASLFSRNLL
jgi:TolB-like protein/Tfp pilus assembly protein PilF